MRKIYLILTIGGGFTGFALTFQAFFTAEQVNLVYYVIVATFVALYGYGMFAGLRLADRPEDKKHLVIFYWLQVPWISSPVISYRFTSGFNLSGAILDFKLTGFFRLGSDWQFSLLQAAPWGIGVNFFALVIAILLTKQLLLSPAVPGNSTGLVQ